MKFYTFVDISNSYNVINGNYSPFFPPLIVIQAFNEVNTAIRETLHIPGIFIQKEYEFF